MKNVVQIAFAALLLGAGYVFPEGVRAPVLHVPANLAQVLSHLPADCAAQVLSQITDTVDFDEDPGEFLRMQMANRQMGLALPLIQNVEFPVQERGRPRNRWQLAQALGYTKLGQTRIEKPIVQTRKDGTSETVIQRIPYYEVLLPYAQTGLYFPNGETPDLLADKIDAVAVVLGGIGFDFSTAKSVVGIAGTFNKVLKGAQDINPFIPEFQGRPLRVLCLPMDAPLNGMGERAPFYFGHPKRIMGILHHTQMLLSWLFPGKPIFFAGRSQGGANVLEGASVLPNIAGVMAVNPSLPIAEVVAHVIETHMDPESKIVKSLKLVPHMKSWVGHNMFTMEYEFLKRQSVAPSLVFVSKNDPGFPQHIYRPAIERFIDEDPLHRSLAPFDDVDELKAHDLWNVENREVYNRVVQQMGRFMLEHGIQ